MGKTDATTKIGLMVAYVVGLILLSFFIISTSRGLGFDFPIFLRMLIMMGIISMLISACAVYLMKMQQIIFKILSFLVLIPAAFLIPRVFSLWAFVGVQVVPDPYPFFFTITAVALASFTLTMWGTRNQPKSTRIKVPLTVLVVWMLIFIMFSFYTVSYAS